MVAVVVVVVIVVVVVHSSYNNNQPTKDPPKTTDTHSSVLCEYWALWELAAHDSDFNMGILL